jgi:hypothetical protein
VQEADRPPSRPRDLDPESLGFDPQPPVRWFSPRVLVDAGIRSILTATFGSFVDKRELQARLEGEVDSQHANRSEVWVDYVADTGDGFDATYSVAWLVAQRALTVAVPGGEIGSDDGGAVEDGGRSRPLVLPRGQLLVLGGDQIYPIATTQDYAHRFEGPFRAALPWTDDQHPTLFALPGNHDWYDGLTGFFRQFAQGRWIGGWRTTQSRSYFAVQLPHRWWLWGMDIQADRHIDEPQIEFFRKVLKRARRGDRLVLAVASPTWVRAEREPESCRNLAYVERKLLEPRGVRLELVLAGDRHHYARYTLRPPPSVDGSPGSDPTPDAPPTATHRITAGGGGAFLAPTHDLPTRVRLPVDPRATMSRKRRRRPRRPLPQHHYELATCYPDRTRSRLLASAALLMPVRNPGVLWVTGLAHVMLLWTDLFGIRSLEERPRESERSFAAAAEAASWVDLAVGLLRNPLSALLLVILVCGLFGLAEAPPGARSRGAQRLSRFALGLVHSSAHVATVVAVSLLAIRLTSRWDDARFAVGVSLIDAAVGAIVGAVVVGGYFAVTNALPGLGLHGNEAFSAARLSCYRNFVRLHIDRNGTLTVYAVGLDRITRRWRPDPDAPDPEQSWLAAEPTLAPRLIDEVVIE